MRLICLSLLVVVVVVGCVAQSGAPIPAAAGGNDQVVAAPSRPTFSNSADALSPGVAQLEYGWTRSWAGAGVHADALNTSLQFGVTRSLDVRWSGDDLLRRAETDSHVVRGFGDSSVSARYRFMKQDGSRPSLDLLYSVKFPTASTSKGFGSGFVDHTLTFLVSKDAGRHHFDFNLAGSLLGAPAGSEHAVVAALAWSHPLTERIGAVMEGYGGGQPGAEFVSTLVGMSYRVTPRFVVDASIDVGVHGPVPRKRFLVGGTYAIGNFYRYFKKY